MPERCDVLVITPPRRATLPNMIADIHPPLTQGIDSVPLRLAAVAEQRYATGYLPLYHLQYNYYALDAAAIRSELRACRPAVVVIANDYFISNRTTACFPAAMQIAAICREELPGVRIIFAGKHAIVRPEEHIAAEGDVAVAGEAEELLPDLIHALLNRRPLGEIPGLYYVDGGQVIHSGRPAGVPDVDRLPPPAYHLLRPRLGALLEQEQPWGQTLPLTLRTSYGCRYQCPYCAGVPQWRQYRLRSKEGVAADVDAARTALGADAEFIFLDDELFTADRGHVHAVADVFAARQIMLEGALTHVRCFDADIAAQLARFCGIVMFGAENFVDGVLQGVGKGQDRAAILQAAQTAHQAGLGVRLEFICGLPDETVDTMGENLNFVYNALVQQWVDQVIPYVLCPHPGTAFGEHPERWGISIAHRRYDEYIEEGGYPACATAALSRTQIYLYYQMFRQVVAMAATARRMATQPVALARFSRELFREFFAAMEGKETEYEQGSTLLRHP